MPATASERRETRQAPVRWELHGISADIQVRAIETMPLVPKEWLAEFEIDPNWNEYYHNPRAHIKNSREKGYVPFSFANFVFSEHSGIITPSPQNPLTFYLRPDKWLIDDSDAIYKSVQIEIAQAMVEGKRPNNVRFNGMNGGFEQYQALVHKFPENGYNFRLGNYSLSLKEGEHVIKDSSFHLGDSFDGVWLELDGGLTGGEVLQLTDWFNKLEQEAKQKDPSVRVVKK